MDPTNWRVTCGKVTPQVVTTSGASRFAGPWRRCRLWLSSESLVLCAWGWTVVSLFSLRRLSHMPLVVPPANLSVATVQGGALASPKRRCCLLLSSELLVLHARRWVIVSLFSLRRLSPMPLVVPPASLSAATVQGRALDLSSLVVLFFHAREFIRSLICTLLAAIAQGGALVLLLHTDSTISLVQLCLELLVASDICRSIQFVDT